MAFKSETVSLAVELDEVLTAGRDLILDIVAKKSLNDVVSANLQKVFSAVDKVGDVVTEFNTNSRDFCGTIGLRIGQTIGALLAPAVVVKAVQK